MHRIAAHSRVAPTPTIQARPDVPPSSTIAPPPQNGTVVAVSIAGLIIAAAILLDLALGGLLALVLVPIGAYLAYRHPVAAVLTLFLVLGFAGTLLAFAEVRVRPIADFVLVSLWVGVLVGYLRGRDRPLWLWPGLLAPALYCVLTVLWAAFDSPAPDRLAPLHLSVWTMSAVLLAAMAPWTRDRAPALAKAALVAGGAVGAYALYQWLAGPTHEEELVAKAAVPPKPFGVGLRFYGSLPAAQSLALVTATILPVAAALMLTWRGRWRVLAAAVVALCGFAVVASEVRTGTVAAVAGIALVLLLYQMSRAFPGGTRVATSLAAIVTVAVIGVGGFAMTVGASDERSERFARILTPGEDFAYESRVALWEDAWPLVLREPFGHGLGTSGNLAAEQDEFVPPAADYLDSTYLKVGIEQGLFMMLLFIAALIALAVGIAGRAIATRDQTAAALGIGATGSLLAFAIFFYTGFYIEQAQTLIPWLLIGIGAGQFTGPPGAGESSSR